MGQTILKICFAFLILIFSSNCVQANEYINTGFVELTSDESQTVVGGYSDTTNAILCIVAGTALIASTLVTTVIALPLGVAAFVAAGVITILACPASPMLFNLLYLPIGLACGIGTVILINTYNMFAIYVGCILIKDGINTLILINDSKSKTKFQGQESSTTVYKNYNYGDLSQFESSSFNSTDVLQLSMSF